MSFEIVSFPIYLLLVLVGGGYLFASVVHPTRLPPWGEIDWCLRRNVVAVRIAGWLLLLSGCLWAAVVTIHV